MRLLTFYLSLLIVPSLQAQECEVRLFGSNGDEGEALGTDVALQGDISISGAPTFPFTGAVFVHLRNAMGSWSDGPMLQPATLTPQGLFGRSVALDGNLLVVGAPGLPLGFQLGAAYVFETLDGGLSWSLLATLSASDEMPGDHFGFDVAVNGSTILVGAPDHGGGSGAAYVFERSGSSVTEVQKLGLLAPTAFDRFGSALDLDGDLAVFGLSNRTGGALGSGTAFVFARNSGVFTQQQQLNASNAEPFDGFGFSVALCDDLLTFGAPEVDTVTNAAGAVYVFRETAGVWNEVAFLTGSGLASNDNLGYSVATDGIRVAAGAPGAKGGEAYVYGEVSGTWTELRRIRPMLILLNAMAGISLSISGDQLQMGDPTDVLGDPLGGATYGGSTYIVKTAGVDLDADGFTDNCVDWGREYCGPAVPNSTGSPATISAVGSPYAIDGLLELRAEGVPQFMFAYFLASQTPGLFAFPGGSQGNLCLGGTIGRFIGQTGSTGSGIGGTSFRIVVDTRSLPNPLPAVLASGQTWNFQLWYRDNNPTATSNFTNAFHCMFL